MTLMAKPIAPPSKEPPAPAGLSGGGPSEDDYEGAHAVVWRSIGGAMQASQLYLGDKLKLYATLRDMCAGEGAAVTAPELARASGLKVRWLREWLAQQAAMGVLRLLPGDGDGDDDLHYRLPKAMATVLADEASPEYDVALVQMVPSLVNRAKTRLPSAFKTGLGQPYDDPDVASAIDRAHRKHIHHAFLPKVLPAAVVSANPTTPAAAAAAAATPVSVHSLLAAGGAAVADLGCGGGALLAALAAAYPDSTFHGYEVSDAALECCAASPLLHQLGNAKVHDARVEPLGDAPHPFDVVVTLDVLHDAPFPADLIAQVKRRLRPGGTWLLADIAGLAGTRANLESNPAAATLYAFSTCLCMSCALSEPGGAGLGTLGFSVPVATRMLAAAGFTDVTVLLEADNTRWFQVRV